MHCCQAHKSVFPNNRLPRFFYIGGLFAILATYTPTLLYCASNIEIETKPSIHKMVEGAGNMTYASYLIHFPLQLLIVLVFSEVALRNRTTG